MFAALWPPPESVPLDGGGTLSVRQLRLRDLAALESWARARAATRAGTPASLLDKAAAEPDSKARRSMLRAAYDLAEAGAIDVTGEMNTPEGLADLLYLSAGPDADPGSLSPRDWQRVLRAALAIDPLDEAAAAIDAEIGAVWPDAIPTPGAGDARRLPWLLMETLGYTPDQLGDLTIGQWVYLVNRGEEPDHPTVFPAVAGHGKALEEGVLLPRERFWAEAEAEATGPDAG